MKAGSLHRGGGCLVPHAMAAVAWWSRLRGLLFRPALAADGSEALLIAPCASVHTVGMGYPLDVVFLDAGDRVIGLRPHVAPWRACAQRGARSTLEFHHGVIERFAIRLGDVIEWRAR